MPAASQRDDAGELEVTARQAAIQTGVSYPTALGVFTIIRRAFSHGSGPEQKRRPRRLFLLEFL
jgi:hypothetical protein